MPTETKDQARWRLRSIVLINTPFTGVLADVCVRRIQAEVTHQQELHADLVSKVRSLRIHHDPGEKPERTSHVISWTNAIDEALAILESK